MPSYRVTVDTLQPLNIENINHPGILDEHRHTCASDCMNVPGKRILGNNWRCLSNHSNDIIGALNTSTSGLRDMKPVILHPQTMTTIMNTERAQTCNLHTHASSAQLSTVGHTM